MKRNRRRENAGVSPNSWKKHGLIGRAAQGQACAYRYTHPAARCLIVDMHAGDGAGVPIPQLDLFEDRPSFATAELARRLAQTIGNTDVILCEIDADKRQHLAEQFPETTILADHAQVPDLIRPEYHWALIFNDPCGYASHGITTMEILASLLPIDWVIAFNEGALGRLYGVQANGTGPEHPFVTRVREAKATYQWMLEPTKWAHLVGSRQMARSKLIQGSSSFRYRILVMSHTLSQTLRPPTWEKIL